MAIASSYYSSASVCAYAHSLRLPGPGKSSNQKVVLSRFHGISCFSGHSVSPVQACSGSAHFGAERHRTRVIDFEERVMSSDQ